MSPMIKDSDAGLNLSDPEAWTEEEQRAFTDRYMRVKERTLPGHDFWIEQRPDVLKRYRQYAVVMDDDQGNEFPKIGPLCFLHHYAIVGFDLGILYQIINARNRGGADKDTILAVLAVAFLQSGPLGTTSVADSSAEYMRHFVPPEEPTGWPEGWSADPEWSHTGLDYSETDLMPGELELLEQWYERTVGEVPRNVRFLAKHRPTVLKAYQHRFEFAVKDALPKEMVPLMLLQFEVTQSRGGAIRQAALMARKMGISKGFAMNAVSRGAMYGGPASVDIVDEFAADVFDDWD
jgi:hypothetical protein